VVRASADSFQLKWTEQTFENGRLARTERWTGILSIVVQQPRSVEALRKNPLGIYVHGLDWSREINPGETP
jgi:type IV secretion system protein VirB5